MANRSLGSGWKVPAPTAPFGAMMPTKQTNNVYGDLAANWRVNPGKDYLSTFLNKYNDIYGKMNANLTGTGAAGLGQFDPGNAGMGTFATSSYISPLLDSMKARIASEYNAPKTSLGYLTSMDQIAAQEEGARQNLANQFGGNQRGSGVYAAAQAALARDLARNKATASRETEMQARDMANKNAFGLEGMLQGQFNTEQGARQAAYEAARQGELANMGLKSSAYEAARNRELDNSRLNSQFALEGNSALAGLLNPLSGMLQWDAARGPAAQAQSWQNLKDLYGFRDQQLARDKQYEVEAYNAAKQNYEQGDEYKRMMDYWKYFNPTPQAAGSPYGRGFGGRSNFAGGFAKGGKVDSGEWAIVGENGPEILDATGEDVNVIPLDDKPNIMRQIVGRMLMAAPADSMAPDATMGRMKGAQPMLRSGQMAEMTDTVGGMFNRGGGPVAGAIPHRMGGSYDATTALSPMALAAWRKFRGGMAKGGTLHTGAGDGLDLQDMAWQQRLKDRDKELALAALMDKLNNGTMVDNSTGQTPVAAYDVPQELQGQYGAKYLTNRMMPGAQAPDEMESIGGYMGQMGGLNVPGGSLTDKGNIDWSSLADESTPMYAQSEGFREPRMVPGTQGGNMAAIQQALLGGIIDKGTADTFMKPMELAQQAADRKELQAARLAEGKARQDERMAEADRIRQDKLGREQAADEGQMKALMSGLDRMETTANDLLTTNKEGVQRISGYSGYVPGYGDVLTMRGTKGADAKAKIENLKTKVGFEVLQEMRNNSKTGGALGQVSDFENKMLQQAIDNLDTAQSDKQLLSAIQSIKDTAGKIKARYQEAYNNKWKTGGGAAAAPAPAQAGRFTVREIQ